MPKQTYAQKLDEFMSASNLKYIEPEPITVPVVEPEPSPDPVPEPSA